MSGIGPSGRGGLRRRPSTNFWMNSKLPTRRDCARVVSSPSWRRVSCSSHHAASFGGPAYARWTPLWSLAKIARIRALASAPNQSSRSRRECASSGMAPLSRSAAGSGLQFQLHNLRRLTATVWLPASLRVPGRRALRIARCLTQQSSVRDQSTRAVHTSNRATITSPTGA